MTLTRRLTQLGFLSLTIVAVFVLRANAERWCPFGGVEAIYGYFFSASGDMPCSLGVSNFFILGGVLLSLVLVRRAFCGYACPIGTISQWLHGGAKRLRLKQFKVSPRVDRLLSPLKYVLLVVVLYLTWQATELIFRSFDPCYALIGRHGEDITFWAYVVSGVVIVASLVLTMPFCRWFCPLAAVMNLFSWIGFARVRRHPDACLDCKKCDTVCPMAINVSTAETVTAARCISCMRCVDVCPDQAEGALDWGPPRQSARRWTPSVVVGVLVVCLGGAVIASYAIPLPSAIRMRGALPDNAHTLEIAVSGVNCRGSVTRLWEKRLARDDFFALSGPLRLEAWPGPGFARIIIHYDPAQIVEEDLRVAITEPIFDMESGAWRTYAFDIEGYDPFGFE